MKQVFLSQPASTGIEVALDERQAHHLFDVLRTTPKETVRVVADSQVYLAHTTTKPNLYIFSQADVQERSTDVTLCAALIKGDKWEWMLQKAAELGVGRIVPFVSQNTVVQIDPKKEARKMERWRTILEQACRQCNRHDSVILEAPIKLREIPLFKQETNIACYEKESSLHLCCAIADKSKNICAVIGPEGGFSADEAQYLEDNGFTLCHLGPRILRAETAACYVLSAIDYQEQLESALCPIQE